LRSHQRLHAADVLTAEFALERDQVGPARQLARRCLCEEELCRYKLRVCFVAPGNHGRDGHKHHRHGDNNQNGLNSHDLPPANWNQANGFGQRRFALDQAVQFSAKKIRPCATGRAALTNGLQPPREVLSLALRQFGPRIPLEALMRLAIVLFALLFALCARFGRR
jgi:hypothetical protein